MLSGSLQAAKHDFGVTKSGTRRRQLVSRVQTRPSLMRSRSTDCRHSHAVSPHSRSSFPCVAEKIGLQLRWSNLEKKKRRRVLGGGGNGLTGGGEGGGGGVDIRCARAALPGPRRIATASTIRRHT